VELLQVEVVREVETETGVTLYAHLMTQGEVFACQEMLTRSTHEKTRRAHGHVEVLALANADFTEVLRTFPDVYRRVQDYAADHYNYSI